MKKGNIQYKIFVDHRKPMTLIEEKILNQYGLRSSRSGNGTKGNPCVWRSVVGDLIFYIVSNHRSFRQIQDIHQVYNLYNRISY